MYIKVQPYEKICSLVAGQNGPFGTEHSKANLIWNGRVSKGLQ